MNNLISTSVFQGKRRADGEWVEGDFVRDWNGMGAAIRSAKHSHWLFWRPSVHLLTYMTKIKRKSFMAILSRTNTTLFKSLYYNQCSY